MRSIRTSSVVVLAAFAAAGFTVGCTRESSSPGNGTPPGTDAGSVTVALAPAQGNALTCGKVKATVTGAADTSVTWSASPAHVGNADGTTYDLPIVTPSPATLSLTATSVAAPSASATGAFTLATAFPSAAVPTGGVTDGESYGVFPHAIAAKGTRVFGVWPTSAGTSAKLMLARSDDGGATWKAGAEAIAVALTSDNDKIDCGAVAIDAANPDVVYAIARVTGKNDLGAAVGGEGATLILATSADGGATFTRRVLQVGGTAGGPNGGWDQVGICGDVVSPAANTVVVESPGAYNGDGNPDMIVWTDAARGAGFASGHVDSSDYVANGFSTALAKVPDGAGGRLAIAQNGGTDSAGGATEAPRLFTDGAGRTCITYIGRADLTGGGGSSTHTYVQCSDDAGVTFSLPRQLDPADGLNEHSSPVGALGPGKRAAVVWTDGIVDGHLFLATSTDAGAHFGEPIAVPTYRAPGTSDGMPVTNPTLAYDANGVLWLAYRAYDGGFQDRLVVDKSCDFGATWSGAVLVNGPEGNSIVGAKWPAFATTSGDAPHVAAVDAQKRLVSFALTP